MSRNSSIKVNGTKALMQLVAPKMAALLQGDWLVIDQNTRVKIDDLVNVVVSAAGGKTVVTFSQPLPISVDRGFGPFHAKFQGTIQGVIEIDASGASLVLGSLPDQVLEWSP